MYMTYFTGWQKQNADQKPETLFGPKAASELTALAAAMARSARVPMLQCWRALPTAVAAAKVDHSDTALDWSWR